MAADMTDARCSTCPLWQERPGRVEGAGRDGYGWCHHVSASDESDPNRYGDWWCSEHPLRQRDRLAAMAMEGMLAAESEADGLWTPPFAGLASRAYAIADAMLAERAKGQP